MPRFPRTADVPDFPPIEAGWYFVTIYAVKEQKKDKNGNDFIPIEFKIDDNGRKVWDNFHLDENHLWKLKSFLKELDPTLVDQEFDGELLVGKQIVAHIIQDGEWARIREYAGVGKVNPADANKPLIDDDPLPF
jgi:hypothetical protein